MPNTTPTGTRVRRMSDIHAARRASRSAAKSRIVTLASSDGWSVSGP